MIRRKTFSYQVNCLTFKTVLYQLERYYPDESIFSRKNKNSLSRRDRRRFAVYERERPVSEGVKGRGCWPVVVAGGATAGMQNPVWVSVAERWNWLMAFLLCRMHVADSIAAYSSKTNRRRTARRAVIILELSDDKQQDRILHSKMITWIIRLFIYLLQNDLL